MEAIWKGKQTNKQTSGGSMCRGTDAGGGVELRSMQSLMHNTSEYAEELWRCIGDTLEKHGVQYAGLYSDMELKTSGSSISSESSRSFECSDSTCSTSM